MEETEQFIKEWNEGIKKLFACQCCYPEQYQAAEILAKDFEKQIRSYYLNYVNQQLEQLKTSLEIIKDD